jgi:hypothetical protein
MLLFFLLVFPHHPFLKCLAVSCTRVWNKPNQYFTVMLNALPLALSERNVNSVTVFVADLDTFSIFLQNIACVLSSPPPATWLAQGFTLALCVIPDLPYIRHT